MANRIRSATVCHAGKPDRRCSGSLAPALSPPAQPAAPGVYLIDRPGRQQADLTLAARLDAPASPANPVNAVLTNVPGDSVASRIHADLRDRRQWACWTSGSIEGGRAGQMLLIRTPFQVPRVAEAIAAIRRHIGSIDGNTPVSADELQRATDRLTLSPPPAASRGHRLAGHRRSGTDAGV